MPKGLRSFDAGDADFFLELVPGQRDRNGLPESIRFWKTRIEETDTDHTFAVGLLYGPSGCGKSSLVKAGLIPRLAPHVLPIYIEATPADTEVRLLKGLRKACPAIPAEASLPEVCESLREGNWLSVDEQSFVTEVVNGLAQDGKVVSVRLALFAEMVKSKPWTAGTLVDVGGTQGIGVNFLEETFSAREANPDHRLHAVAARGILKALLPELGTDIKGGMRSQHELQEASGYQDRPSDFADLMQILDRELRLITPTDPEGERQGVSPPCTTHRFYQLTHDYLVPSLRDWLTRKQRETRKGRAELKLEERSAIWNSKRENKQLPTVAEWLSIGVLTDSKRWTDTQRTMMGKAARVHGALWGGLLLTVLLAGIGIQQWASAERWKNLQDRTRAAAESLQNNLGPTVPVNLKELGKLPAELVLPELRARFASATNARHKLSLAFALAGYGELDAEYRASRIDDIAEMDTRNYVSALQANAATAIAALKAKALKCTDKPFWRRKAKLSIAALVLGDTDLALDVCTYENRPNPEKRTLFIDECPRWDLDLKAVLAAVKNSDSPALRSGICLAVGQIPDEQVIDADKESWKLVASQWFVQHGDTSTHSAAGWLLRHWKLPLPEISQPHEITTERDWFVVKTTGATMLRIRSAASDVSGNPNPTSAMKSPREFWVGDREVTRGQFEDFMNDTNYAATEKPAGWDGVDATASPTGDHPAQGVSWYDAVMYCNWLSLREGLNPCYERTGTREKGSFDEIEYDAWRLIPGSTGYRLLHEAEWEYACRAGTATKFSSGDDEMLLVGYCQMYPSKQTATCGEKLPNAWGIYDAQGNVWEWCGGLYLEGNSDRVLRGGSFYSTASTAASAYRFINPPVYRYLINGFRVVRTLLPVPLTALPPAAGGSKFKN